MNPMRWSGEVDPDRANRAIRTRLNGELLVTLHSFPREFWIVVVLRIPTEAL
jgi:hypothetical protein